MARKLAKQKIEAIRLVADYLVIQDLKKNVLAKGLSDEQLKDYEATLRKQCPQVFEAGEELGRQLKKVRQTWLELLTQDSANE